jgi:serine/threonine protein phosphatase PrpC
VSKIEQVLTAHAADDETAVRALWAAAMNAGGRDNITIILARIEHDPDPKPGSGS